MKDSIMASKIDDPKAYKRLVGLSLRKEWLQADRESDALLELWNLCDLRQQQDLIYLLLDNYTFISSKDLKEIGHKIAEHIEKVWELCPGNTRIVALSEDAEADGSQMFLQSLKNKLEAPGWTEASFFNSLPVGMYKAVNDDNLVLVDDFIGTGSTAERKVKWLFERLAKRGIQNVKTYLVTTAGMEFARSRLDNLGIEYYSPSWLKKGISDRFDGYERDDAIAWMKHLEHKLVKCKKQEEWEYALGFGGSETLYAIEAFNVPDNVFPVFWWPTLAGGQARRPIFRRLKTR